MAILENRHLWKGSKVLLPLVVDAYHNRPNAAFYGKLDIKEICRRTVETASGGIAH